MKNRPLYAILTVCLLCFGIWFTGCDDKDEQLSPDHTGSVETGDEVNTLALPDTGLVVVDYMLDRQQERIAGSVMNNSSISFVNVQVAFQVFDAQGQMVGTVADTTSEVQPGDVWQFGIPLPPDEAISRVQPVNVQGAPRSLPGGEDVDIDRDDNEGVTGPPTSEEAVRTPATGN